MNIKPIPTEYEGIRFRSKSEAIFARAMTLAGFEWAYEPDFIDDFYYPDFEVNFEKDPQKPSLYFFVEYKPSRPTDTYIERISKKVGEIEASGSSVTFGVFWGTAYGDECGMMTWAESRWISKAIHHLFMEPVVDFLSEAKVYRFDLQATG